MPLTGGSPLGISSGNKSSYSCNKSENTLGKHWLISLVAKQAPLYSSTNIGLLACKVCLTSLDLAIKLTFFLFFSLGRFLSCFSLPSFFSLIALSTLFLFSLFFLSLSKVLFLLSR